MTSSCAAARVRRASPRPTSPSGCSRGAVTAARTPSPVRSGVSCTTTPQRRRHRLTARRALHDARGGRRRGRAGLARQGSRQGLQIALSIGLQIALGGRFTALSFSYGPPVAVNSRTCVPRSCLSSNATHTLWSSRARLAAPLGGPKRRLNKQRSNGHRGAPPARRQRARSHPPADSARAPGGRSAAAAAGARRAILGARRAAMPARGSSDAVDTLPAGKRGSAAVEDAGDARSPRARAGSKRAKADERRASGGGGGGGGYGGVSEGTYGTGMDGDDEAEAALRMPWMESVVKVFCTHVEPNFSLPWQRKRQYQVRTLGHGRVVCLRLAGHDAAAEVERERPWRPRAGWQRRPGPRRDSTGDFDKRRRRQSGTHGLGLSRFE